MSGSVSSVSCIVRYDYDGEQNDELTLRVGDVITQVTNADNGSLGWWRGTLGQHTGIFPENFVSVYSLGDDDKSQNFVGSPVQLRPKGSLTSANVSPLNRTPSFKMSSNLFDPEDEETVSPLFGVLSLETSPDTLSQSIRGSDISSVTSVVSQKGFLGRLRHSVGSRLPNFLSTSRLSVGSKVGGSFDSRNSFGGKIGGSLREDDCSQKLGKRRKSITTFFKRTASNSSISKGNKHSGEKEGKPSRRSKSRDFVRRSLTLRPFSQEADEEVVDFGCGLSSACQSEEDKNPLASLSWTWQEMGEKGNNADIGISSWEGLNSGLCPASGHKLDRKSQDSEDSGIDKTLSPYFTNPDAIFGSVPELCDEIFNDIFNFFPGDKAGEKIDNGLTDTRSHDFDKDSKMETLPKKRNPIRTNPHVNWNRSISVYNMENSNSVNFNAKLSYKTSSSSEIKTNQVNNNKEMIMDENENKVNQDLDNDKTCREDKVMGEAERKVLRRNPIRTNPHYKWNAPKTVRDKEKVTSI